MKTLRSILILLIFIFSAELQSSQPYVLVVCMDGFRWDYLDRNITPNINKFAEKGVKAMSLMPVFPSKTFPNHYSIITGQYPENHGIISNSFSDPYTGKSYSLSNIDEVKNSRWYHGEAFWETAKRNGIITASYFWPGSELNIEYRRPDLYNEYDHKKPFNDRIDGVKKWLELPYQQRPHFVTLYFHEPDAVGHSKGVYADETNNTLMSLDSLFGTLINKMNELDIADSLNIILLSDHGMSDLSDDKMIDLEELLKDLNCKYQNNGTFVMIEAESKTRDDVYNYLKSNANGFSAYHKEDMPEYLHYFKHPFISNILLLAENGWHFTEKSKASKYKDKMVATHGWDNHWLNMHGIFMADGPAFKDNYKVGTIWNIDIYPLLCSIFGIEPISRIDGKAERIIFLLDK